MGAGVNRSVAYAARKVSGGKDKRGGVVEIDFNLANSDGVNIYSRRDGDADFEFLARDTVLAAPESCEGGPPYVDNHPLLAAGKPELREYKCVSVLSDEEISQFSDEVVVNCAPWQLKPFIVSATGKSANRLTKPARA